MAVFPAPSVPAPPETGGRAPADQPYGREGLSEALLPVAPSIIPDRAHPQPEFLPVSREEMRRLGWSAPDVLLVSGDAYVDHPSTGTALLGRLLLAHGFRTAILAQPRWDSLEDMLRLGRPRLFVGISAGALDSLLAHYTAFRKKRHDDAYTPGGRAGARPNRACIVYANLARRAFPGLPIVLGGIEASLRRITHYDFWTDALRRSLLLDARADVLVYGMGERATLEIARRCAQGRPLRDIPGTCWLGTEEDIPDDAPRIRLPSHEEILREAPLLMQATLALERQVHWADHYALQAVNQRLLLLAPPAAGLSTPEMDNLYALPFQRSAHPSYTQPVPAAEMLRTSITSHRGCGGGCSFCSLALHQGRRICSRSEQSIVQEVRRLTRLPRFSGAISDIGGPTANMWQASCTRQEGRCRRSSCCFPTPCPFFVTPQLRHVRLLRKVRELPGISSVRIASGIRADIALREEEAVRAYTGEFTGGQLKVAPEHCTDKVLRLMRKPPLAVFEAFLKGFRRYSRQAQREQYVVPYLMSAFPGCEREDMEVLQRWLMARGWKPRQVQCFIPTPGTVATAMFYTGQDEHGRPIAVARTDAERMRLHYLLQPECGRKPLRQAAQPCGKGDRKKRGADVAGTDSPAGQKGRSTGTVRPRSARRPQEHRVPTLPEGSGGGQPGGTHDPDRERSRLQETAPQRSTRRRSHPSRRGRPA